MSVCGYMIKWSEINMGVCRGYVMSPWSLNVFTHGASLEMRANWRDSVVILNRMKVATAVVC